MIDDPVAAFLARERASRRVLIRRSEAVRLAALWALAACCAWIAWPEALGSIAWGGGLVVAAVLLVVPFLRRESVAALDDRLGLDGWLTTHGERGGDVAAHGWLARDLVTRLERLPEPVQRDRLAWLPLRRPLRITALVVLLLLLLRIVWLPPLPRGVLPLAGRAAAAGPAGDDGRGATRPGTQTRTEDPTGASPQGGDVAAGASRDDASPGREIPQHEITPLEAPLADAFLVPELEAGAASSSAASPTGGDAGSGATDTPSEPERDFARAAETALRSRHVPPNEREAVRRWFGSPPVRR